MPLPILSGSPPSPPQLPYCAGAAAASATAKLAAGNCGSSTAHRCPVRPSRFPGRIPRAGRRHRAATRPTRGLDEARQGRPQRRPPWCARAPGGALSRWRPWTRRARHAEKRVRTEISAGRTAGDIRQPAGKSSSRYRKGCQLPGDHRPQDPARTAARINRESQIVWLPFRGGPGTRQAVAPMDRTGKDMSKTVLPGGGAQLTRGPRASRPRRAGPLLRSQDGRVPVLPPGARRGAPGPPGAGRPGRGVRDGIVLRLAPGEGGRAGRCRRH